MASIETPLAAPEVVIVHVLDFGVGVGRGA
jgi:hypothetical protein